MPVRSRIQRHVEILRLTYGIGFVGQEHRMSTTASAEPSLEELFATPPSSAEATSSAGPAKDFVPQPPEDFKHASITSAMAESLLLKFLLAHGSTKGRVLSEELALPLKDSKEMLTGLKNEQLVFYKDSAQLDFTYALTEDGRERAKKYVQECSYLGSAPVSLAEYIASVNKQTIAGEMPRRDDLQRAFSDLLISDELFSRLGPAINSGRGMFLYGPPGNGKTSIAERITSCFGTEVWVPRTIQIEGQIIMLFDPQVHEPVELGSSIIKAKQYDRRWIKIKRPTIVVGGELTMDALEIRYDPVSKISHAPLQMKSNCGSLVIDDFGRQRINPFELLNRWIVPLEKRYDFLQLITGTKIQVPFDQLIIFSTNLEPKDLVDDAFLRRIPYKIEVPDPTETEFRQLMQIVSAQSGVEPNAEALDHLIARYRTEERPFRCCHPRDLLAQIKNQCDYEGGQAAMTRETFDFAMTNYFTIM